MIGLRHLVSATSMVLALAYSCQALAVRKDLDGNAGRMARGLPLLKPKRMFDPTRAVPRAEPSGVPPASCVVGHISFNQADKFGTKTGQWGWISEGHTIVADVAGATLYKMDGLGVASRLTKYNDPNAFLTLTSGKSAGSQHPWSNEWSVPSFTNTIYPPRTEVVDPVTSETRIRETPMWRIYDYHPDYPYLTPTWTNAQGDYFGPYELGAFGYEDQIFFSGFPGASGPANPERFPIRDNIKFGYVTFEVVPGLPCNP